MTAALEYLEQFGQRLANWQATEEGTNSPFDLATIAHTQPTTREISDAIMREHEAHIARSKTAQPTSVRGVLKVTGSLGGMVFTPFDSEDGDKIYERVDMDKLYAGINVTITI